MVDRIPSPGASGGAVWEHDWFPYERYRAIHTRFINNAIDEGIIINDRLVFLESGLGSKLLEVRIRGRIECAYGLSVFVDKWLKANERRFVKGYRYSYQAWITKTDQDVIRYDCAHAHGVEGLHCHLFDFLGNGKEEVYEVPISMLPTLDGFIRNAVKMVQDAEG